MVQLLAIKIRFVCVDSWRAVIQSRENSSAFAWQSIAG